MAPIPAKGSAADVKSLSEPIVGTAAFVLHIDYDRCANRHQAFSPAYTSSSVGVRREIRLDVLSRILSVEQSLPLRISCPAPLTCDREKTTRGWADRALLPSLSARGKRLCRSPFRAHARFFPTILALCSQTAADRAQAGRGLRYNRITIKRYLDKVE